MTWVSMPYNHPNENVPHATMVLKPAIILLVFCSGCLSLADPRQKTSQRHAQATPTARVLPQEFRITSWNIQKGTRPGWEDTLASLLKHTDLLMLQEAYLTEELQAALAQQHLHWDQATAYTYRDIPAGVLTASALRPASVEAMQYKEPIIQVPKTMLVTTYPLADEDPALLVVNVHIINFTLATAPVQNQLFNLNAILEDHPGPVVICGDFNTWKQKRIDMLDAWAADHHLTQVPFEEDRRSGFLGNPVDYVFYRGLNLVEATCPEVSTSDHNPLAVTFEIPAP